MNYKYQCTSLERQACMVVARSLCINWNGWNDIDHDISIFCSHNEPQQWIERVSEKLPLLLLPTVMQSELKCSIQTTFHEMLHWISTLNKMLGHDGIEVRGWNNVVWSCTGTIDQTLTAQGIVRDYSIKLDLCDRFILACAYFLETDIQELEKELYCQGWCEQDIVDKTEKRSEILCSEIFNGGEFYGLNEALLDPEVEGFLYLLQLCAPESRQEILRESLDFIAREHTFYCGFSSLFSNKFYALLPLLDDKHKKKLFADRAERVLSCFLIHPRQHNF